MFNHTIHMNDALYYCNNPNIKVGSHKHLPVIVLSYTFATIFVFLPTLLLCCFPIKPFRKALFFCCSTRQHTVAMFMDTFQGYYKDGTEGTCDWSFLAELYPLLRVGIIWSGRHFSNGSSDHGHSQLMCCVIVSTIISIVRPYKKLIHNLVEILLLNTTTMLMWCITESQTIYFFNDITHVILIILLLLVPHLVLTLMIAHRVIQLLLHHLELSYNCRLINKFPWLAAAWKWLTSAVKEQALTATGQSVVTSYGTM